MRASALPFDQPRDAALPTPLYPKFTLADGERGGHLDPRTDAAAPVCHMLSVDDLKKIPGFEQLVSEAKEEHGSGSYHLKTYDKKLPGKAATICVNGPAQVKYDSGAANKKLYCNEVVADAKGELTGTNGTVALMVLQGVQVTAQLTISNAASFGLSNMYQTQVAFPGVADLFDFFTTSVSITNTQTQSFTTTYTDQTTLSLTMSSVEGKTCYAKEVVEQCTIPGTGRIELLVEGDALFEYNSPTGEKDDKKAGKHYKWSQTIDNLPKQDRSGYIEFRVSLQVTTHGKFKGHKHIGAEPVLHMGSKLSPRYFKHVSSSISVALFLFNNQAQTGQHQRSS
ncbi:hypothetical protein F5050DRAFT_1809168 [Lentinula boryana]|uniref:Uncharacterized protein n=1 Tax=Lentinula boryana TaxID=40481 RepID=A0ABQ8Q8V3_9AGAR|nr:hypothetical protein F5050DRAFT_1809168 [Lentinula boryana]